MVCQYKVINYDMHIFSICARRKVERKTNRLKERRGYDHQENPVDH